MNVHHLELFYYVAKYKGIIRACREMPYGIQQPAVSTQLITLEKALGVKLFHRKPFALTPAGEKLYEFSAPFFGNLDRMEAILHGELSQEVRLAGSSDLMRDHVPAIIKKLKKSFPKLKLKLTAANQAQAEQLIDQGQADIAVTVLENSPPSGFKTKRLIELPLVLLIPRQNKKSPKFSSAKEILDTPSHLRPPLIAMPEKEMLTRIFLTKLKKKKISWPLDIEANSLDIIAKYVTAGMGIGLTVALPETHPPSGLTELPLHAFPKLPIGAYWRGSLPEVPKSFLDSLICYAETLTVQE